MADKVQATFHGRGCPWCGSDRYYTETAKYYCPDCHQCGVLPTPVETYTREQDYRKLRNTYLRNLLTTIGISVAFFVLLHFLGAWGYLIGVPGIAAYFAHKEIR